MTKVSIPENLCDLRIHHYNKPFGSRYNGINYESTFTLSVPLPKNFSWNIITDDDDNSIKVIKERILNAQYQGKCGNCYAFALTSVLSDLFVIKYGLNKNPDISPSYINTNYTELKGCAGGNPVSVLQLISTKGVVSNRCIDNSVCLKDDRCNGQDSDNLPTEQLNSLYRDIGSGCYRNRKNQHKLYFPNIQEDVKEAYFKVYPNYDAALSKEILKGSINAHDFLEVDNGLTTYPKDWSLLRHDQVEAMTQIYRNGPAVGMIYVVNVLMEPFYECKVFRDVFDGLVFDSVIYNKNDTYSYQNPQLINISEMQSSDYKLQFSGGHAVSIMGYGVCDKEIPLMDFNTKKIVKVKNIPFWWVRNSWGENWNPDYKGYFKLPMYPFNKVMQVDVPIGEHRINNMPVSIPTPYSSKREGLGGILIFEAGDISDYNNKKSNNYYKENNIFSNSKKYVKFDEPEYYLTSAHEFIIKGGVIKDSKGQIVNRIKYNHSNFAFALAFVLFIILMLIIYFYRKSQ